MKTFVLRIILVLLVSVPSAYAATAPTVPSGQQAGGIEAGRALQEKEQKLREAAEKPKSSAEVERPEEVKPGVPEAQKALVNTIEVSGVTFFPAKAINGITRHYEGRMLTVAEMQEVVNKITDLYRQSGYITSRAVLPPQKIENGVLKINVLEGLMGKVEIKGNKYYRASLIKSRIGLKEGEPFNYTKLQNNLSQLNQYSDRHVQTVLTPSTTPGVTDLVLNVTDQLPLHVGMSYDNYGSRYLRKGRYQGSLTHNNLLGHDDIMTLMYQTAEGEDTYRLSSLRYLVPVTTRTQIGFVASDTHLKLGKEFEDLNARGKSRIYTVYGTHALWSNETTDISLNAAFDYKDVFNFELNNETSRDRLREARAGGKIDRSDSMGRTIINNEMAQGIADIWGGLKKTDPRSSRLGSGGQFTTDVLDAIRVQKMFYASTLLVRGQAQFASTILPASEQFQIGGISNVRAYPSGEVVGDNGQSVTAEWSFPLYGLPKNIQVPFSKAKAYDALRLAVFYDWANAQLRAPAANESKNKSLSGVGCGFRVDLPEDFIFRVDVAWSLDDKPSDSRHAHTWVKISKSF